MFSVYILLSEKDKRTYVGYSHDVNQRLRQHNSGQVRATRHRLPLRVLFTEEFETEAEAKSRELWWKSSSGRSELKRYFGRLSKDL